MSRVAACWDCGSLLQRTLEQKLHDASLKPSAFAGILRALLAHGSADAKAYAITQAQTSTERKLVAASILFQAANDAGWSTVWPAISSNVIFGRRFTQAVSGGFDEARLDFLKKLTEDQIADLYIWVSQQFPENEDPAHPSGRAHSVGDREEIGMWRDKLLEYLVNRGTLAAYNAMQKIQASGCHDCTYSLVRALRAMRERWTPLTVEQILAMQRDTEKRLVRNADECQHGIYLIGWFKSDKWDPDNIRRWRNGAQDWTLDAARMHFNQQAERLSTGTLRLQAFVMDAGIRH